MKNPSLKLGLFCACMLLVSCTRKEEFPNYTLITTSDKPQDILKKAAELTPSAKQITWQEMELTGFVHFGINTFTDREWGTGTEDPVLFNPTEFNAEQWVNVLKEAGMKMIIVTAKHHDGFCLWPSRYTEHTVKKSPWKNGNGDVVKEVSEACRAAGLKFGVYLSPWDRHEPAYGDSPKYNIYFRRQLRELLNKYAPVSEVWFDGACAEGPNGKRQVYDWASYYRVIRELAPDAVIAIMGPDVRWVGTETGYGRETEWSVVPVQPDEPFSEEMLKKRPMEGLWTPKDLTEKDLGSRDKIYGARVLAWYPSEVDVSIRPGWFYHEAEDEKVKTPEKLLDIYFSSVGRNSVLLLNVPPDKRGLINENDIRSLKRWREILDSTFAVNYAAGAQVQTTAEGRRYLAHYCVDEDPGTFWYPDKGVEQAQLTFQLKKMSTFDVLMLQENTHIGQRIEGFYLEAWTGDSWKKVTGGTTVGYKRILRFPPVTSGSVRLKITSARARPTLQTFGLYKIPGPAVRKR